MLVFQLPSAAGRALPIVWNAPPVERSTRTICPGSPVRPSSSTRFPAGTAAVGSGPRMTGRTSTSPTMPAWIVQWYPNCPGVSNSRRNVSPAPSGVSNEPSSAVTVWLRSETFSHWMLSPGRMSTTSGPNAWNCTLTGKVPADAVAGSASAAASATNSSTPRVTASPSRHPVDADHPAHHVILHVAVVEPRPGILLAPAEAEALRRPDRLRIARHAAGGYPTVAVDVEGVVLRAHAHHVPLDELADGRMEDRRIANKGTAVDRHELAERREDDLKLLVRRLLVAPEDRE